MKVKWSTMPLQTDHPLRPWLEALWLMAALLTPLFVNFWVEQQFEASKVWLLRTLIWVLALLWLGSRLDGFRPRSLPPPIPSLVIALLLVLTLSTLSSPNPTLAVYGSLERAHGLLTQASYLLLFAGVATLIDGPGGRRLLLVMILTAVPICLLGLAQAAGWQPLPVLTDARSPLTTTLGRANFTGAYLALLLPLTLSAARSAAGRRVRSGFAGLFAVELLVIALTGARAAWIAALVSIGVFTWLTFAPAWSRRGRWLTALVGLGGSAAAFLLVFQRAIAGGGSIAARWTIWQASLRLLWPRLWLGYGADSLELYFPSVYPPQLVYYQGRGVVVDRAHNWLLDWSLNYGVVATGLLIALVYFILRAGWQRLSDPNLSSERPPDGLFPETHRLAACMAAVCAHLAGNLFLFDVAATAVVFWLLLAMITAGTTHSDQSVGANHLSGENRAPFSPVVRWTVMGAALVVVCWGIWQGNVRPLLADRHSWRGTQALSQGNAAAALAEYTAAVAQQPRSAPYRIAAGLTAAQMGNFSLAEQMLADAIALRPADPVVYTHLAAVYAREAVENENPARLEAAYAAYEQAIALAPTIALTYQQYADLALRAGDSDRARRLAERAVDLDATDGISFGILGWAQMAGDNLPAAELAFEQAVKWEPGSADFHLGLATALYLQGRFEAAHLALERSLLLDPTYPPALTLQLQLQDN